MRTIIHERRLAEGDEWITSRSAARIEYGARYIEGEASPYFTVTVAGRGALNSRDRILEFAPDLRPLAALHLSSTVDGAPVHAVSNGWYWMAGALGGAGEKYHGGSGTGAKTPDECLQIFAEHCRVSIEDATIIRRACARMGASGKLACEQAIDNMRPRWAAEAATAIEQFGLQGCND